MFIDMLSFLRLGHIADEQNIAPLISVFQTTGNRFTQEDRYSVINLLDGSLVCISDGHNGAEASDIVAKNIGAIFEEEYVKTWDEVGSRNDLNIEEEQEIIKRVVSKLARKTNALNSGATLSLCYFRSIGADEDMKRRVRVLLATLGDSPVAIHDGEEFHMTPLHSALKGAPDFTHIQTLIQEAVSTNDSSHSYWNAAIENGYLWINARTPSKPKGLSLTRCLGDREFSHVLSREPYVNAFDVRTDSVILMASDGVLLDSQQKLAEERLDELILHAKDNGFERMTKLLLESEDNATVIFIKFLESL